MAIDLPIKVAVFEDEQGETQVRINGIGYLTDRHDLPVADWPSWIYQRATEQFAEPADGLVTIDANQSVEEAAEAIVEVISGNDAFGIPLVLNYRSHWWSRRDATLIVFGNPNAGTPLMQTSQEIAIDLPQKMLVWRDGNQTKITYNDPFFVAARHDVVGQDARLGAIAGALANFAAAGASSD